MSASDKKVFTAKDLLEYAIRMIETAKTAEEAQFNSISSIRQAIYFLSKDGATIKDDLTPYA